MGDDYIPGNKCGLSTAGMKMLSGVAVAYGLEDVSGSATPLQNFVHLCAHSCSLISLCVWTYACVCINACVYRDPLDVSPIDVMSTITVLNVPSFVNIQFVLP